MTVHPTTDGAAVRETVAVLLRGASARGWVAQGHLDAA